MKRATKWLAFMLIVAMVTTALLANTAMVLAQEAAASDDSPKGVIEALVWDDLKSPDGKYTDADLVDGIKVRLYHLEDKVLVTNPDDPYLFELEYKNWLNWTVKDRWNGTWVPYDTKVTGYGGFAFGQDAMFEYMHGWVGWNDLPLDAWNDNTFYKLELDTSGTFIPLDSGERIAALNPGNRHVKAYLPGTFADTPPFEIKSTTAAISGTVWSDANADLNRQWAERALEGWTVVLTNRYGSRIASTKTNIYGYYYFQGLKPGTYKVWVAGQRNWKQVAPYYKWCAWPPRGCEKGHHTISAVAGKYYQNCEFGFLDMRDSIWATLYYGLWWLGLLQFQFSR